jgi:hypothetical protein
MIACLLAGGLLAAFANAQVNDPTRYNGATGSNVPDNTPGINGMTQMQVSQLRNYLSEVALINGTIRQGVSENARKDVTAVITAMHLPCVAEQGALAAIEAAPANPKDIRSKTYEVSCSNGMGYFIVVRREGDPQAFTCFAAEAQRLADIAAGHTPGIGCAIVPDVKLMAQTVMQRTNRQCTVSAVRWIGRSSKSGMEFTEVACGEGAGYVIASAGAGSETPVHISTCQELVPRGIGCKLSAVRE